MNLIEVCDKLRVYLEDWYKEIVNSRKDSNGSAYNKINGKDLADAKKQFFEENKDCQKFDFDIFFGYKYVPGTYYPGCMCCEGNSERVRVNGIVVKPMDWHNLSKYGTKNLPVVEETNDWYYLRKLALRNL